VLNWGVRISDFFRISEGRVSDFQPAPVSMCDQKRILPYGSTLWFIVPAMSTSSLPSQSAEDYLERIHELIEEKGYARVVDIALSLDVKQASVTSMVQKLGELGYLNYEKYRGLILTEKGRAVACLIQQRHETLSRFFSLLGLDEETQRHDIEGIEHHLSPATVACLADLTGFLESHPEVLKAFLRSRPVESKP
jgi:Mn-dependent DtxR family transcriptional regulator